MQKRDLSNVKSFDELTEEELNEVIESLNALRELGEKYKMLNGIDLTKLDIMTNEVKKAKAA